MIVILSTVHWVVTTDNECCNKLAIQTKNYTKANPNLLTVNFVTMIRSGDNFLKMLDL